MVHNGIIENFADLKEELEADGIEFKSDTDTEVLAHLVGRYYDGDLAAAVRQAVDRAVGAYALVVMTSHEPGHIVAVRMISPLVIGYGEGEMYPGVWRACIVGAHPIDVDCRGRRDGFDDR